MKSVLTIAGSDSCGGAGIQADIKTMTMNGVYAMSALTALTAQNTLGVTAIFDVSPEFLQKQLDAVFTDIFPDAVKIGMLSSAELIEVISKCLNTYKPKNIVLDPVMVSTSGTKLITDDAVSALKSKLLPLADLITPNIPEASVLAKMDISDSHDMEKAAKKIYKEYGASVLLKGGHSINDANDLLYSKNQMIWFNTKRIDNINTHGTGCTLSSAIASNLAKGISLDESIRSAKKYISGALAANLNLGKGPGPLMHNYNLETIDNMC